MIGYFVALCVLAVLILPMRSEQMTRVYAALLCNWAANTSYVLYSGVYDPATWFAMTDMIAAAIILSHPAGRVQAAIGWIYMAQIITHAVYFLRGGTEIDAYLTLLDQLGALQMILLGGWGIGRWGKTARDNLLRRWPSLAGEARRDGMGEG